ncbi:MAG: Nramp family divalent metal transporter [Promethearchaeia archaeon]
MNADNSSQSSTNDLEPRISKPPLKPKAFFKYLGPAFIFTAAQIGGGELITVPLLGAYLGMRALFLAPLIAYIKIFGQYYLVQYGVVRGKTFLQTCWDKKWLRWMFFLLMLGCILHSMMMAGLLGETAGTVNFLIPFGTESETSINIWILIIMFIGFLLVVTHSYSLLEKTASILLWIFLSLIIIVAALFWPTWSQWLFGFSPQLPGAIAGLETTTGLATVSVLFVVLGAGFGPTVSYIWYAKDKEMGMFEVEAKGYDINPQDLTSEEKTRLQGWRKVVLYQNVVSATILTVFSVLIWVASAQTLFVQGYRPEGWDLIPQMVSIFTTTWGEWSGILFIIAGILALFSSVIGPLYGFSRLYEESFERFGIYRRFKIKSETIYRIFLVFFVSLPLMFIFLIPEDPMWLFSMSGLLTGPVLGLVYILPIAVTYLEMKNTAPELKPERTWAVVLALTSGILMFVLSLLNFFS